MLARPGRRGCGRARRSLASGVGRTAGASPSISAALPGRWTRAPNRSSTTRGQRLDDLFLTLAPQVAGRDGVMERPGLVIGKRFAPEHPRWGTLAGVKRGASHLFLRYSFGSREKHGP